MTPMSACRLVFGIGLLVFVLGGCAKEEEPLKQAGPALVRKKVASKKVTEAPAPSPKVVKAVPSEDEKPVKIARQSVPAPEDKPVPSAVEPGSPFMEDLASKEPGKTEALFYDPKGKSDPFMPPSARMQPSELPKKTPKKHRLPLTPLQKVDLSQLKLVGIIVSPAGNKALVEEPSGKGYVITRGTYVGPNYGRVRRILTDRVIVEEEVEDFFSGEMQLQTSELILQKKLGEI